MSLQSSRWWGAFVEGLRSRPLSAWSSELGVPEEELSRALVEADPGGPAQAAPWWPEALRLRVHTPIRALARHFGTEPRRLRRAFAREGLRAGGRELQGRGDPLLARFLGRLGTEPDATIARAAGVAIESVQGERRRLGIAPFGVRPGGQRLGADSTRLARDPSRPPADPARHPPDALRLTSEEVAWIRGPEPLRRPRPRPDAEGLEVVRRPRSGADPARPTSPAPLPPRVSTPPAAPLVTHGSDGTHAHRVSRDFFRARDSGELDRLLQPAPRPRDGRQRIVRIDAPRPEVRRSVSDVRPRPNKTPTVPARVAPPPPSAPLVIEGRAPIPAAPVAPTPVVSPPAPLLVWHVRIAGDEIPMVVEAPDAWGAARVAASRLPRHLWDKVAVVLAEVDTGLLV